MGMHATELRKNLFQSLETASKGTAIDIEYKGVALKLEAVGGGSKLARAIRRNAIVSNPDDLVLPDTELLNELSAKWADEDAKL